MKVTTDSLTGVADALGHPPFIPCTPGHDGGDQAEHQCL